MVDETARPSCRLAEPGPEPGGGDVEHDSMNAWLPGSRQPPRRCVIPRATRTPNFMDAAERARSAQEFRAGPLTGRTRHRPRQR